MQKVIIKRAWGFFTEVNKESLKNFKQERDTISFVYIKFTLAAMG